MLRMMLGAHRKRVQPNLAPLSEHSDGENSCETQSEAEQESLNESVHPETEDQVLEPWPEFIRRVTHRMEESLQKIGMQDWVTLQRQRKWAFATKVLRQTDGRWTSRLIKWRMRERPGRSPGVPATRWTDDFSELAGGNWDHLAATTEMWSLLEHAFTHREDVQERVGDRVG